MEMTLRDEVKFLRSKLYGLRKTYRRQVKDLNNALARERLAHENTIMRNALRISAKEALNGQVESRRGPQDRLARSLSDE